MNCHCHLETNRLIDYKANACIHFTETAILNMFSSIGIRIFFFFGGGGVKFFILFPQSGNLSVFCQVINLLH